jgi:membrane protein YqaA with SNARE-associated domain
VFSIRNRAQELAQYGYPGIFLLSILSNATILLPAPGILFVFAMGAVFSPLGVAIAAGLGAAIGELSGYLAGFSGQQVVENIQTYERIRTWMEKHKWLSYLAILVLAAVPNPFFDLAGIAAGTLKIPIFNFLFFCIIGKTMKMLFFAYAGATSFKWIINN